ncbi:MAG: hypothetical protein L0I24_17180, partial [Pseudonocardia sp.]|nr:hypothetical protein [Pseudonocardia sp.]
GRDLVLKVGWRHPEAEHAADGLHAWRDRGAVRVHATHVAGATSALLLERAGAPLGELRPLLDAGRNDHAGATSSCRLNRHQERC